jgi:hypothetical protein
MPLIGADAECEYGHVQASLRSPTMIAVLGSFGERHLTDLCARYERTGEWPNHIEEADHMRANMTEAA